MTLTERQIRNLNKKILPEESVKRLWRAISWSAVARISLRNHYMSQASLDLGKVLDYKVRVNTKQ